MNSSIFYYCITKSPLIWLKLFFDLYFYCFSFILTNQQLRELHVLNNMQYWCKFAFSQMQPYCEYVNGIFPMTLFGETNDSVIFDIVLSGRFLCKKNHIAFSWEGFPCKFITFSWTNLCTLFASQNSVRKIKTLSLLLFRIFSEFK